MSASLLSPVNGAVAVAGLGGVEFQAFTRDESQAVESVAAFGTAVYDPYVGSGTPHASMSAQGFALAHATNTVPFGAGVMTHTGINTTLTYDTGVSTAETSIVSRLTLSESRIRAVVPLSFSLEGASDPTTTWPTS